MDEYIKRKAVIDLITRRYEKPEICTQEINSIPAADVAPVVRCKDCKHRYSDSWCEYVDDDDNFYCARGERKDGAD